MSSSLLAPQRPRPPLRQQPDQPDDGDSDRAQFYNRLWESQRYALMPFHLQIEENVRMLLNQQWLMFNPSLGMYVDVATWFTDAERRWHHWPVLNKEIGWFILTHARMTENSPVFTYVPGPDAEDAQLAEALDTLIKYEWRRMAALDSLSRILAWVLAAGRAYSHLYVDPSKGPWVPHMVEQLEVPVIDAGGTVARMQLMPNVPVTKDGEPTIWITPDGPGPRPDPLNPGQPMRPHFRRKGQLCLEPLSPFEVRGKWGPAPWHQKRWHALERWMTTEQVKERFGVDLKPTGSASMERATRELLYSGNLYNPGGIMPFWGVGPSDALGQLCQVRFYWEAPTSIDDPQLEEQPDSPGGRFLVLGNNDTILFDGPRPVAYPHVSALYAYDFVRVPGRNQGMSTLETLHGPQRTINKLEKSDLRHEHLLSDPKPIVDTGSNVDEWDNEPGKAVKVRRRAGILPVEFLTPPPRGEATARLKVEAWTRFDQLAMTKSDVVPGPDPSGELLKQLRYDADRPLGSTQRAIVEELVRVQETMLILLPLVYDRPQLLSIMGDDNLALNVMLYPEMFVPESVNVQGDLESMYPESRAERQERVTGWYERGLFGPVGSLEAVSKFFEMGRFPHYARAGKLGGEDFARAERDLGLLVNGAPAASIPVFPWYNSDVEIMVCEKLMKTQRFRSLPPQVRANIVAHWSAHKEKQAAEQAAAMQQQLALAGAQVQASGKGPSNGRPKKNTPRSADALMPQPETATGAVPFAPDMNSQVVMQ